MKQLNNEKICFKIEIALGQECLLLTTGQCHHLETETLDLNLCWKVIFTIDLVSIGMGHMTFMIVMKFVRIKGTRFPGAVPQPIGLFLFCIEFGWG